MRLNLRSAFVLATACLFTAAAGATSFKPTCHTKKAGNGGYGSGETNGHANTSPGKGPEAGGSVSPVTPPAYSGSVVTGGSANAGVAVPVAIIPGAGSGASPGSPEYGNGWSEYTAPEYGEPPGAYYVDLPESVNKAPKRLSKRERMRAALAKRRSLLDAYLARNKHLLNREPAAQQDAKFDVQPSAIAVSYQPAAIGGGAETGR